MVESIGVSLGWNCHSAIFGVSAGLRLEKVNGYTTCPFDETLTNYEGVVACIQDDFKHFMDIELIDTAENSEYMANETVLYNPWYKFIFNHESPGHANLWKTQKWTGGKGHYITNNYEKFRERYTRRINNFRNSLTSGKHINFIITKEDPNFDELHTALRLAYPSLSYTINHLALERDKEHYYSHLALMHCDISDKSKI